MASITYLTLQIVMDEYQELAEIFTAIDAYNIIPLMLLSHCGEYSCEYEYLNFAVNSPKNCDWIVNIFISVTPRSSSVLDLSLPISYEYITNAYQRLPMLANALRIANERCQRLRTLYQRYQWLTNAYENQRRMTVFTTFAEI